MQEGKNANNEREGMTTELEKGGDGLEEKGRARERTNRNRMTAEIPDEIHKEKNDKSTLSEDEGSDTKETDNREGKGDDKNGEEKQKEKEGNERGKQKEKKNKKKITVKKWTK